MIVKQKTQIFVIIISVLAVLAALFISSQFFKIPFPRKDFKLGLDLQGGVHLIYQADLAEIAEADRAQAMEGLRDVLERRVNLFGVSEPVVQVQGERLIIELAGIIDPAQAIKEIGKTPFLEFREQKDNYQEIVDKNKKIIEENGDQSTLEDPFRATPLTGRYLKRAEVTFDQITGAPSVSLEFNEEGAKVFGEVTEKNIGKILAIYIDGILISAPVVQEKISQGRAQISGRFSVEQAKELATNLSAGALPVPINLISQQSVGPTLGLVSLEESLRAGIYGFLAIVIFMIIFYRLPGLLASIALIIYVLLVLSLFKLIPVTLTLAGIAGFLLSIGMAVDANILIFSRMREEMSEGKNFNTSVEEGFNRAWPSIRDSNLNTLIVSVILFGFATSFIKGFALTLSLGVVVSMFSAIFITRTFLRCFVGTRFEKVKWLW